MAKATSGLAFANPKVLEEQTFKDPDFDSSYALLAREKGALIGAALGVARGAQGARTGYFKYFSLLPKFRGKGHGRALFSELERRFQKRDVRELKVGACPPPFLQGGVESTDTATVCFLMARGYQRSGEIIDMTAPLAKWKPSEKPEDKALVKEFKIRRAKPAYGAMLAEMAAAHFPGWAYEIAAGQRFGAVFLAEQGGKAVAFCSGDGTNPGVFGPMGTLEAARGKGLARILHNKTLEFMKRAGHKAARIPWVGPIPFYARLSGAKLGPVYWCFAKKV